MFFLNFQLTKKRAELVKVVRQAKKDKKIVKYGTDQNGRVTVRVQSSSPWVVVTSQSSLQQYISSPPVAARQHR